MAPAKRFAFTVWAYGRFLYTEGTLSYRLAAGYDNKRAAAKSHVPYFCNEA